MSEGDAKNHWFGVLSDAKVQLSQRSTMVTPKFDGIVFHCILKSYGNTERYYMSTSKYLLHPSTTIMLNLQKVVIKTELTLSQSLSCQLSEFIRTPGTVGKLVLQFYKSCFNPKNSAIPHEPSEFGASHNQTLAQTIRLQSPKGLWSPTCNPQPLLSSLPLG